MFKMYQLKDLIEFDLFVALDMLSSSQDISEFDTMEELDAFMKTEFEESTGMFSPYLDEPESIIIVDTEKKIIIKRDYTLKLGVKTYKSDEAIQKVIDVEAKKLKEEQKKRDEQFKHVYAKDGSKSNDGKEKI